MNDQVTSPQEPTSELIIPDWLWEIQYPQIYNNQSLCSEVGLPFTPKDLTEIIVEDADEEA